PASLYFFIYESIYSFFLTYIFIIFFLMPRHPLSSTLFPYTTLFRSIDSMHTINVDTRFMESPPLFVIGTFPRLLYHTLINIKSTDYGRDRLMKFASVKDDFHVRLVLKAFFTN